MSRDSEKNRLFTRRAVLLGGAKMGLLSLLFGRLYYLQVLQRDKFTTLAEDNRINLRLIAPPRGQIVDRNGAPLAVNQQNYRLVLLPEQVEALDPLLKRLGSYVSLADVDIKRIERELKAHNVNAVMVRDNLTWDQVSAISLHTPDLPGADIEVGEVRTYPYTSTMAHAVGYVGAISQNEKDGNEELAALPGYKVGKSGIEKQYDMLLRGEPGRLQLEVNARGRVVRELSRDVPTPGKDIKLTIDIGLQQMVQKRLEGEKSATAVVMDIYTGAIYAQYSHPSYDPNLFTYGIAQQDWDKLNKDEYVPLLNKALNGVYAPGSTFKIVTALAGLDSGLLDPQEKVYCPGYMDLGTHRFHCWKKGGHGPVNLFQAMAGSCDTYFYEQGKRIGIDRIYAMARRLGLGEKTGIDYPHERPGLMPSRAWKMATRSTPWQQGETLISAIGQGYTVTTPIQLALMIARVANGGLAIRPHIVPPDSLGMPVTSPRSLGLNRKDIGLLMEALSAVVNDPLGTAYSARAADAALTMAGKTGTAQVRHISTAERSGGVIANEDLPWKERDHALFVGVAPVDKPRYAVSVVVEHGGSGAHTAAPIARDILIECQKRNPANV